MTNKDVNGVIRGACSECVCEEFLAGERVRCVTCDHVPNKHLVLVTTEEIKPEVLTNPSPLLHNPQQHNYGIFPVLSTSTNNNPFSSDVSLTETDNTSTTESVTFTSPFIPFKIGNGDNVDVRGVARYSCSMCDCTMYQRPTQGAKCSTCSHPPIKHSAETTPQHIPSFSQPIQSLNNFENPTHSKISTKVNIAPATTDTGTAIAAVSHRVMTSFKSDPPDVVSVSDDNSLIVPTGQAVKITIEINVVPMEK